ncbi:MAG TPA: thioesterase family protein [Thermomicrobiaceae bacterium]|nr:thioesterase family protein [Thermomicrobiaceae bacterium]
MRPIPVGQTATFELVVTPEMTVDFEELGPLHPVYATYWMAKHLELVGRKVLLPYLDPVDEGIGYGVTVRHLAPAAPGMTLRVTGEHVRTEGNRIHVRCRVEDATGELIGEGETVQVVLPRSRLEARLRDALERARVARERTER